MTAHFSRKTAALLFTMCGTMALAQTQNQNPTTPESQADAPLATTPSATIAAADSAAPAVHTGVRIVRLSQVKGGVLLDRAVDQTGAQTFEPAFANIPITQGATLKTTDGVAEVEFEDNSSLRLTPETTVQFSELRRELSGSTASSVKVLEGTVFVSLSPAKGNQFALTSSEGQFAIAPDSRVHFHEGSPKTTVAVLEGSVQAQAGGATTTAGKKTTLTFEPSSPATASLVSHLDKTPFDAWDKQEVDYHKHFMNTASFGSSNGGGSYAGYGGTGSPVYGLNDMNYYGAFSGAGGCGNMWRPYLASAAWDPYSNGILAYYPSAGYSWVSPYPWGWMPYHSGSWINCPGTGWGWQPGGNFNGLTNLSELALKKHGIIVPPLPPKTGRVHLLAVNTQPLKTSGFADRGTFVFSKDSAGLGVPRATFGNLNSTSQYALKYGAVSTPAYTAPETTHGTQGAAVHNNVSFAHAGSNPSFSARSVSSGSASAGGNSSSSASFASTASLSSSAASSGAARGGGGGASAGGGGGHH